MVRSPENNGWTVTPESILGIDNTAKHARFQSSTIRPDVIEKLKSQVFVDDDRKDMWEENNGILTRKNKIYIPDRFFMSIYTERHRYKEQIIPAEAFRIYNNFTENTTLSILYDQPLDVYREGQSISEYQKAYQTLFGSEEETASQSPMYHGGSRIHIKENQDFTVFRHGLGMAGFLPILDSRIERVGESLTALFTIHDLYVELTYTNYDAPLGKLVLARIINTGEINLELKQIDESLKNDLEIKPKDTGSASSFLRVENYAQRNDFTPIYMTDYDNPSIVDDTMSFIRVGRKMTVQNSDNHVSIVVNRKGQLGTDKRDRDFTVIIPKIHPVERIIDHAGNDVNRFDVENKLLADALRREPFQPPHPADILWRYSNVAEAMNVSIDKNNTP